MADASAIHWWFYVENWTPGYLGSPGARRDLVQISGGVMLDYVTLALWAWTTGFVLGSLSRRAIAMNGTLFCVVVFGVGTLATTSIGRACPNKALAFPLTFYSVWFPLILQTVLLVAPALNGMRQGRRVGTLSLPPAILGAIVITTLTTLATSGLESAVMFGWLGQWHLPRLLDPGPDGLVGTADDLVDWRIRILPLTVLWPIGYMLATAAWQHWHALDAGADHFNS
jgi:hypothetical protein